MPVVFEGGAYTLRFHGENEGGRIMLARQRSVNLLRDGLRDVLDPRAAKRV